MNDYIKLLREQVDAEIDYLVRHGHDVKYPPVPCIFCNEFKGHNFCNRLRDLRQFQSTLAVKSNSPTEVKRVSVKPDLPFFDISEMPVIGHSL